MGFKGICRVSGLLAVFGACAYQCFLLFIQNYGYSLVAAFGYGLLSLIFIILSAICIDLIQLNPADSFTLHTMMDAYGWDTLLFIRGWWVFKKIMHFSKDITAHQDNVLKNITNLNKNTSYAKDYKIDKVRNSAEFRKNVPFGSYPMMKDYVERFKEGDYNAVTNDKVRCVIYTSGTTGNKKFYPLTSSVPLDDAKAVKEFSLFRRVGRSMGRHLMLFHSYALAQSKPGKPIIQTQSSVVFCHRPFWLFPREMFYMTDESAFLYCTAIFALREREVDGLKAVFAFIMFSFWVVITNNWKEMCDNIEKGYIDRGSVQVDEETLAKINSWLSPDPERAEELRREFGKGMHGIAKRIWPRVQYVDMVCTGALAHPAKVLQENQLHGIPFFSLYFSASECLMGFNADTELETYKYTLFPINQYFEWIPEANITDPDPATVETAEIEIGQAYELVVTTFSGLTRFRTGDIVNCVDKYDELPVFVFGHRQGQILDVAGEKMTEKILYDSVSHTCQELHIKLIDYTCTSNRHMDEVPAYLAKYKDSEHCDPHYILFCELSRDGMETPLSEGQTKKFDETLRKEHAFYNDLRKAGSLGEMKVLETKREGFEALKALMIRDTQTQQFKMPRVVKDPKLLNFLMTQRHA